MSRPTDALAFNASLARIDDAQHGSHGSQRRGDAVTAHTPPSHTAMDIVRLIRAVGKEGEYEMSDSEAALIVSLFASAAITKAERCLHVAHRGNGKPVEALAILLGGLS